MVHLDSLDLSGVASTLVEIPRSCIASQRREQPVEPRADSEMKGLRGAYIRYQARNVRAAERARMPHGRIELGGIQPRCRTAQTDIAQELGSPCSPTELTLKIFTRPTLPKSYDIVFVGGQTWYPNLDGMRFFAREILPLIRRMRGRRFGEMGSGEVTRRQPRNLSRWESRSPATLKNIRPVVAEAKCYIAPLRIGEEYSAQDP